MAEPDDQKSGDDEERRTGRDRRRAPLTIDLTAAPGSPPRPDRAENSPPPGSRWPNFARFAPQNMDRDTWIGVGSAAAVGGLIALLLLMLLQGIGIVPSPGASAARVASDQARTANEALAAVDRRLAAVETMAQGLPALRSDLTALTGRLATAEQAAATAATNVQGLRTDLTAVRTRVEQAPPAATSADLAALAGRIGRVEAAAAAGGSPLPNALPPVSTPVPSADADARIATLMARLEAAEAAISRLSSAAPPTAAATANAHTVALANVRRAVDAGRPFGPELDVLAALGPDPVTSGLKPFSATGIAARETLKTEFSKVGDAILAATQPPDESLFGRIVSGARGLVSVRPTGPLAGNDPPAIVSRMDAAVAKGDFATALREREALPAAGKAASTEWAGKANARVMADTLFADPAAVTGAVNR